MIQNTSLQAYIEIKPDLGRRQQEIYDLLSHSEGMTNAELASVLNLYPNSITGRIFELREKGLVEEKERRICKSTGRRAICWQVKGREQLSFI